MTNHLLTKKIHLMIKKLLSQYRIVITQRTDQLFTEFLPLGYSMTTLTSVASDLYEDVIIAKCHLGMLITLMDDFADVPTQANVNLLHAIYKIPHDTHSAATKLTPHEIKILNLAKYLHINMFKLISQLPNYNYFENIFRYDYLRAYQANYYAELLTAHPEIIYPTEFSEIRPFNMGMMIAGMIDLLASPKLRLSELGLMREVFRLGQRYGSIANSIFTFAREHMQNDITNEILIRAISRNLISLRMLTQYSPLELQAKVEHIITELQTEQIALLNSVAECEHKILTFSCASYQKSLTQLHALHQTMAGII